MVMDSGWTIKNDYDAMEALEKLISALRNTTSKNDQREILLAAHKDWEPLKPLLGMILNPYETLGITHDAAVEFDGAPVRLKKTRLPETIFGVDGLINDLYTRTLSGHAALKCAKDMLIKSYRHIFPAAVKAVLDKELGCGVGINKINDVWTGLIPVFDVALGRDFDKVVDDKKPWPRTGETWYASRKLDGVRCLALVHNKGRVVLMSRSGREFTCLDVLREEIEERLQGLGDGGGFVLDGELSLETIGGVDDFKGIVSESRRVSHQIKRPKFHIFDLILMRDFENGESMQTFSGRQSVLLELLEYNANYTPRNRARRTRMEIVQQHQVENYSQVLAMMKTVQENGWEGLILRKDAPYKAGRSNDLLKVKLFKDVELYVRKVISGPITVVENGQTLKENAMVAVECSYKGGLVRVGSGFSLAERRRYFRAPGLIVGHEITVKYFDESADKDGKLSLRFPTFKGVVEK